MSLFDYQMEAIDRMKQGQLALLAEMGLGKTRCTLHALNRQSVRALVVAPALVVDTDVWGAEAEKWLPGDVKVRALTGPPEKRLRTLELPPFAPTSIDTVSYENLLWLLDIVALETRYDAIVFDELSKMKHPGTGRFRRMRAPGPSSIETRFGLTGTPVGNHLLDLWGEMFMVAGAAPLGPRFVDYKMKWFYPTDYQCRTWELKAPGFRDAIIESIKPWAFCPKVKLVGMPEFRINRINVPLPSYVHKDLDALAEDLVLRLPQEDIAVLSASARAVKARQLISGAVYLRPGDDTYEEVHTAKLDALKEHVEQLQGEPTICFYWFKHERDRLLRRFPRAREVEDSTSIRDWNAGRIELLLAHPASAGYGLNLQAGGHRMVWYTLPWSLEMWRQSCARLVRLGQRSPFVIADVLLGGLLDTKVLDVLGQKEVVERAVLEGLT